LLDRLLVQIPGQERDPIRAADLTAPQRDRALAALYSALYGPRVTGTGSCTDCGAPFDLDFALPDLLDSLERQAMPEGVITEQNGIYRLPDGRRFRLPTGADEMAVWGQPPDQAAHMLVARCLVEGDPAHAPEEVQAAMSAIAPLLDVDLDAVCPECGAAQTLHFDIQSYLLTALQAEQRQLAQEVHTLAVTYGWGLREIIELPRSQRRTYISLIEAQFARSRR
jgi:hypothetical protein